MLSDDLRLHIRWVHLQPAGEMQAEAQGVQKRASAQYALMARKAACKIGQWIGRVGDDEEEGLRRNRHNSGDNVSVDACIGVEKLQPSGRVAAVRGAASFLVDARGDDYEPRVGKVRIVAGAEFHRRRERGAVLEVGYDTLRALVIFVQNNDL